MNAVEQIAKEVAAAKAHFAAVDTTKISDMEKIARIVSRQVRRGSVECLIAKAVASAARAELRLRG